MAGERRRVVGFAIAMTVATMLLRIGAASPPAHAADPVRTLHVAFASAETSFDPQFASDAASDGIIANVYEAMLDYDYLARPVKLVPRTLEAMPMVQDGGATYVFKLKKGMLFTPDPAFKGKPRELTAADHAYGIKRLLDPAVKSPWLWLVEGKILGSDEARAQAVKAGKFDYDAPIAGLEVVDRYTLKIRLKQPDLRFLYALAVPNTAAVAREVVEAYGQDFGAHPVGTGPYMLGEYKRSAKIVLVANPGVSRGDLRPGGSRAGVVAADRRRAQGQEAPARRAGSRSASSRRARRAGSRSSIASSTCSRDCRPISSIRRSPTASSSPTSRRRASGTRCCCGPTPTGPTSTWRTRWSAATRREQIALRRAIGMAYNVDEQIRVLAKGRAVPAKSPIPPDIAGYDPAQKTQAQLYDPPAARALLDRFGYKDRDGDGYRETAGRHAARHRALVAAHVGGAAGRRAVEEEHGRDRHPHRVQEGQAAGTAQDGAARARFRCAATAGTPTTRTPRISCSCSTGRTPARRTRRGSTCPNSIALYDEARKLPDSPERTRLFDRMTELVIAYAPWRLTVHILEDHLLHASVRNYKPHPIRSQVWQYVDVVPEPRR